MRERNDGAGRFQRPIALPRFAADWGFFNRFPRGAPGRDAAERSLGYESGRAAIEMNWAPLARLFNGRRTTAALDAAKINQRLAVFSGDRDRATPARIHAAAVAPGAPPPPADAYYPEVHLAVPKLCLLLGVMTALGVDRAHYHETNGNCLGVALHEPLWHDDAAADS